MQSLTAKKVTRFVSILLLARLFGEKKDSNKGLEIS